MPDVKVSGIPADTGLDNNHYVLLNDPVGPTTKTTTLGVLRAWLQSVAAWIRPAMIDFSSFPALLGILQTSSGDNTYSSGTPTNAVGLSGLSFTTTRANQKVRITSMTQTYGAPGSYRFYIDGVAVGAPNQIGYGPTTTYAQTKLDFATVAAAGVHTLDLRITATGHRVIHGEGSGLLTVESLFGV